MSQELQAKGVAQKWLSEFADVIASGNANTVAQTFLPQGWLRDVLIFTWDIRALEGREKIVNYLSNTLGPAHISDIALDETPHFVPKEAVFSPKDGPGVVAAFDFESRIGPGRGYVRLMKDKTDGEWRAWAACLMLSELKGHEEAGYESGIYEGHTAAWGDILSDRHLKVETRPYALIVGAGQVGLMVAARFKQMGIPALVVEKNARVGDNWRKRYPTLALHTPKVHHQMLYQPYPDNWPLYTPRDKVADWLETYSLNQDLAVWTKSEIQPHPVYHDDTGKWDVTINHGGTQVIIHPDHIILATGTLGTPRMPTLRNQGQFKGLVFHGAVYGGGKAFMDKKVVVIGSGNTAIDICQDLCTHKATSVTMIQRSPTCVVTSANVTKRIREEWEGVPTEVADFAFGSLGFGARKKVFQGLQEEMWKEEEELHAKLKKGGVNLWMGPEGEGQFVLVYGRGGGYWMDVGGADLIASGDIKVKVSVEPTAFTETTLVLSDGSELEADVVIMATGYNKIRDANKELFGEETINRTCEGPPGYDAEGEIKGAYKFTGHPGLWYATGDFWMARLYSKHLALQLKAIELGLFDVRQQRLAVETNKV